MSDELASLLELSEYDFDELARTQFVPGDQQATFRELAVANAAVHRGVSLDEMLDDLGLPRRGELMPRHPDRRSIWGGWTAQEYFRLCDVYIRSELAQLRSMLNEGPCHAYCTAKKNGVFADERYTIGTGILDAILMMKGTVQFPAVTIAAYLVRKNLLDELCNCAGP